MLFRNYDDGILTNLEMVLKMQCQFASNFTSKSFNLLNFHYNEFWPHQRTDGN